VWLALAPALAHAQASITGSVRDTSGAVLPGVTVEAASPALIEKVRVVVTDGTGQYRIENLRPGLYTVTFTLPGFAIVRREGIELAGTFTATINAELRVGAVEETITVTGETAVVDVQSTTRQRVMDRQILDTIPSDGTALALGVLIPGVTFPRQNVGGVEAQGGRLGGNLSTHGGAQSGEAATTINGVSIAVLPSSSSTTTLRPDPAALQEVAIDTAAVGADMEGGGIRINYVPREGGNTFNGIFIGTFANSAMQGDNFTQELRDRGLSTPNALRRMSDINPGFGGPIRRDRLWFYAAARYNQATQYVAGLFYNRNANNPNAWTFDPDPSRPVVNEARDSDVLLRLTLQATPKHKIGWLWFNSTHCYCPTASATTALEAASRAEYPFQELFQADWTAPLTNRLLMEAGGNRFNGDNDDKPWPELTPRMISVQEQSTGLTYRGSGTSRELPEHMWNLRGTVSYITGSHAFKVGMTRRSGHLTFYGFDNHPLTYRFNNGVPNQITQRAYPFTRQATLKQSLGLFAQDRWTVGGLTLSYGVRYDNAANGFPKQHLGSAELAPTRDITFPAEDFQAYHDLSPKLGVSYDPFGTGKTAVKVSLNRYLTVLPIDGGDVGAANPVNHVVLSTTRSWTDTNGNFVPDCDLLNSLTNGECGAMANANFGKDIPGVTFDPDLVRGWGKREYNWEFSAGIQQELLPRVAADVSYFRRWYGNFTVRDDLAVNPTDFDPFSITAPVDPRLPGGGGYTVDGLYDLKPAKFGVPSSIFVTRAQHYGKEVPIRYWQGVDVNLNARPWSSLLLQGGTSTGRTVRDNCKIAATLDNPSLLYCRVVEAFSTDIKALGSYTIPGVDVQIGGAFQSVRGPEILANYDVPTAVVAPSLGRNLAGGARNVTVNLVAPGTTYGERMNQVDLRVAKILRFGRTRARLNVDLYNALNSNTVLSQNNRFAVWQRPTLILPARLVKLSAQIDF
jgi:hypothetical protein